MIELNAVKADRKEFSLSIPSLTLEKGKMVAVLGNNGSGKSTFLAMLTGFLGFTGDYQLNQKDFSSYGIKEINQLMGFLPQKTSLNMPFDVHYVILTGRFPFTDGFRYRQADHDATDEIITQFDINHLKNRSFSELSGGEKQRVLLARVLNRKSDVLLLDEPLNGIDLRHQHETIKLLKTINPSKTLLVIMHDLGLAVREFDRFLVFSEGSLAYDADKANLDTEILADIFKVKIDFLKHNENLFINTTLA